MTSKPCLICCKESSHNDVYKHSKNTVKECREDGTKTKCGPGTTENHNVENQLQVVFLLRKLLEIPEDTCCLLLQHFGNPNLWIKCCDNCSDLVKKCLTAFEEMVSLQKHYEKLRLDIKNTILKSKETIAVKESKCDAIVRSFVITQDVSRFIKSSESDTENENFRYQVLNKKVNGNSLEMTSNFLKEQQSFIGCGPPLQLSDTDKIEINGYKEISAILTKTITESPHHGVGSSATTNEKERLFHQESDTAVEIDLGCSLKSPVVHPQAYEYDSPAPVLLDKFNEVKVEVENMVPFNADIEAENMIFQQNFQPDDEYQNCQQNIKNFSCHQTTEGDSSTIHGQPISTVDSQSYIIPDDNFDTRSDADHHNQQGMSVHSNVVHENNLGGMKNKLRAQRNWPKNPFKCDICGIAFKYNNTMKIHRKSHTEWKTPECRICGKSFASIKQRNNHMLCHTGKKIWECKVCGVFCHRSTSLETHLRVHTGERPFACTLCSKSFTKVENLNRHVKTHTAETPFKCKICGKFFKVNQSLKDHLSIHGPPSI